MPVTGDGVRYRVTHERIFGEEVNGVVVALAKGGTTRVVVLGEDDKEIARGIARCRPDENFNRKLGREIALGRALKQARELALL